jgi:hypothetical protein
LPFAAVCGKWVKLWYTEDVVRKLRVAGTIQ